MNISFYLIPKSEVCYIHEEDTVGHALRTIREKGFSAVPVINKDGEYRGTVTEGDFLWALTQDYQTDYESMKKTSVMRLRKKWDYKPVSIDARISELDEYIINQNFVPVVDSRGIFIGIITRKVILTELLNKQKEGQEDKAS